VRQFGLQDIAHWQARERGVGAQMGQDTTHKLTMQYGQLYQKYAGPQFQQEMLQQTADILAQNNRPQDVRARARGGAHAGAVPREDCARRAATSGGSTPASTRTWPISERADKAAAIHNVTPILIEMIEQHDEHTTSDAENGIRKLWDLEVRTTTCAARRRAA